VYRRRDQRSTSFATIATTALISSVASVLIVRNFLETEKKIKHRIVTEYGVGDPAFVRTMGALLGPPLLPGNRVKMLQNGKEIFPAMLSAIRSAQRTITFENFVFADGRISDEFAEAFAERARAGVKVHFLQDALGCEHPRGWAIDLMKRSGVEVEIFRYLHLTRMNFRTHRKLLVVDGKVGFIGGVGISDAWDTDGVTRGEWRDSQYRVEGPVVGQFQQAFMDNWIQTRAAVLHGDDYFPELLPDGDQTCQVFKSSESEGADSARLMLLVSIAAARKSIRIANAYFVPDDLTIEMLVDAQRRGVQVEIIVPGEDLDQQLVRKIGRSRWKPMLDAGVRFFEYQPARFHCKYMIVDDCWCSVGSTNFDNRSLRLNEEANLNILCCDFAADHARIFEKDKSLSKEVTLRAWSHRPLSEKISGHLGCVLRSQI